MKKNIAIYHNIMWPNYKGAVFSELYALAQTVNEYNITFTHVSPTSIDRAKMSPVDLSYHQYPVNVLFDEPYESVSKFSRCLRLIQYALKSRAGLIILPGYSKIEFWCMLVVCIVTGKRRAVFVDSTKIDQRKSFIKDFLKILFFHSCDGFFCYGLRSAEYVLSFGIDAEKIVKGCQAAALPHNYSPSVALNNRILKAISHGPAAYLFVGRLIHEKSIDTLLQAFQLTYRDQPDVTLTIVGSGPLESEVRDMIGALNLDSAVFLTGALNSSQLEHYYLTATCLILPSKSEAWGLVVNEALSYGCPVIASDRCGCVPELVTNGVTGYQFKTGDIKELAIKMQQLPEEMHDVSYTARNCIERMALYTPKAAASRILDGCIRIASPA